MTAAEQSRAPRSFRGALPDPAYWVWRRLTSVRWAIGLILVTALVSGAGVVIPQVPPQFADSPERVEEHVEAQRGTWGWFTDVLADFPWFYEADGGVFNLFNQPYWYALVGLVAVAISVCTVSRAPPIWRTVRRPPRRVNAAYFERARHRFAAELPAGTGAEAAADALSAALASRRFRVSRVAEGGPAGRAAAAGRLPSGAAGVSSTAGAREGSLGISAAAGGSPTVDSEGGSSGGSAPADSEAGPGRAGGSLDGSSTAGSEAELRGAGGSLSGSSGAGSGGGAVLLFADRYGWAQLATFATHIALLLLLGATLVTKFAGEEYQFWVAEGESRPLFAAGDERPQVQIIVDDAVARFADDGQALDFRSFVRVAEGGREVAAGEVTVNGPVSAAGYRVHQASYWEHGAALDIRDAETGQLVYSEAHFLAEQAVAPRVRVERFGALLSEEAVALEHAVRAGEGAGEAEIARAEAAGYTVIPLFEDRSLAIALVPGHAGDGEEELGPLEFWYRIVANRADGYAGMTLAELGVDADAPVGPDVRISDLEGNAVFEGVAPLDQEIEGGSRLTTGVLADGDLAIGLRGGEDPVFFYYSFSAESDRGGIAAGESAELPGAGLRIEYRGVGPDRSRQGMLEAGERRRVGAIELAYLGAETVFFEAVRGLPGAEGESLIALERFGQARTAETFDARGGENVRLTQDTTATSAGGQVGRPSRLVLGLPGQGRIELDEGESARAGGLVYEFAGPREFTGLNVRRDPGAVAFWVGVGLGIAGMTATFFTPRRRVWVRIAEGRAALAGQAAHGVPMARELRAICAAAGLAPAGEPEAERERSGRFGDDYRSARRGGGG